MIIKLGSLQLKVGGKKAEPEPTPEPEYKATMADVLDPEGLLSPNKFAGLTVRGVRQQDELEEASRRSQAELIARQRREAELQEERKWRQNEREYEIREANKQAISEPCPECGSTYECVHKAVKKFRGDYGQ